MAYKRYIKKGGKTYGPYFYESYKKNGQVFSRYIGTEDPDEKKKVKKFFKKTFSKEFLFGAGFVFFLLVIFLISRNGLTGFVTLNFQEEYIAGDVVNGSVDFILKQGELVPADTIVRVDNAGEISDYKLSDLIRGNVNKISGDFYVSGKEISGSGEGYGLEGWKILNYSDVEFSMRIFEQVVKNETSSTETENQTSETGENETSQELVENQTETSENISSESETSETIVEETSDEGSGESAESSEVSESEETSDGVEEQESAENEASENPETEEIPKDLEVSESEETSDEGSETGTSVITGGVITEINEVEIISGVVNINEPFIYELEENYGAELISSEPEGEANLRVEDSKAIVTTDYAEKEPGFGSEYLTDETLNLSIALNEIGLTAKEGNFKVQLIYGDKELAAINQEIKSDFEEMENQTQIDETENQTIPEVNETFENDSIIVSDNLTRDMPISEVRVNWPVTWKKVVDINETGNMTIELPKEADKIKIYKIKKEIIRDSEQLKEITQEKQEINETSEFNESENLIDNNSVNESEILENSTDYENKTLNESNNSGVYAIYTNKTSITGNVVISETFDGERGFFSRIFATLTGRAIETVNGSSGKKSVLIDEQTIKEENLSQIEIEYETPGPLGFEEPLSKGSANKKIVISSDIPFENITAYTDIPENVRVRGDEIKLFWIGEKNVSITEEVLVNKTLINETTNESYVAEVFEEKIIGYEVQEVREQVNTTNYDFNKDGFVDYIEWIVPHLSTQEYLLIIEISKAEHLDSNRSFIENVYDEVKARDGNFTLIPDGDYLRVTFEQELDNTKDITIYARAKCNYSVIINDTEIPCEVYEIKKQLDKLRGEF